MRRSKKMSARARDPKKPRNLREVAGIHAVKEVLRVRPDQVSALWLDKEFQSNSELKALDQLAQRHGIAVKLQNEATLNHVCASHQGVCALVAEAPKLNWQIVEDSERPMVLLALDGITDPHNLGAILRTAWLMGASGVLVPERRAVHLTPAAAKVASGGAEHVPVEVVEGLPKVLEKLKELGFWIFGLAAGAKQNLWQVEFPERVVIVIGAEDRGMRPGVEKVCDQLLGISQIDADASYNASVAAALVLGEAARQAKNL